MERGKASAAANAFGGITKRRVLEIPSFSGEDAYLWVSRMEQYFNANPTMNDRDKFRAAIAALEDPAFNWYVDWKQCTAAALTWSSFKDAVVHHFQPEAAYNPFLLLLNIRQTGTVAEYRDLFETLSSSESFRHLSLSDEISRAIFLNGLREDVRVELETDKVDSLSDLMHKAQVVEESKPKAAPLMKLWGEIGGKRKVVVLVASSACNSQIAKGLVKELGLPVCETGACFEDFTGSVVKSEGLCRGVKIKVHEDFEITHDFLVFDQLGRNVEIALGRDWIKKVGEPTESNLAMMKLKVAGNNLEGLPFSHCA